MKAHLTFNLPEETEEFRDALHGTKYRAAIDEIWNKVFRPYFKHGYADAEINKLLEADKCKDLLEKLAELYRESIDDIREDL